MEIELDGDNYKENIGMLLKGDLDDSRFGDHQFDDMIQEDSPSRSNEIKTL